MTAEGDLPERYRLLLSKVKEALGKRTVDLINRFSLSRLRNEMQTTDIMELTEDKLNDWETRLRSYDRSVGDLSKAAVSEYEQERKGKSKLVTQQTNLLNEIIEAQKRTGIFEPGKRTKLKQLFKEVEAMDLDDLDEEMLAMYDTELRAIDSRAISTREFTPEQKKAMLEMMKRQTKLVSVIDLAKKELGWKHPMKQSQLNKLRSQVETAPVEELTEDDFSLWDEELKTIDPKAGSSVIRNAAEEKKLLELRKKKALLVTLVEKSRKQAKLFSDARSTLGKLLKEMDGTSDDDLSEDDISLWEDTYKSVDPKAVGLNEQMALDEAQAKVLKKRDDLKKTIRKDIAKANRHKSKTTKDFIKGANSVIDLIDTKKSEEYTDKYHNWVESSYKNIQETYPIGQATKLEADHTPIASVMPSPEKPKPIDIAGRTEKIRSRVSGGNVIYSASPTRSDIQQGLENNRAEKAASEKLQKAQEERATKAQATADNTSKGVQALGQITVQEVGVLQQILGELRNVIGAVADSKAKTNATIEQTAVKSISIMKNYADGSFQQLAPVASHPLTREPAINIRKTL
jgi:hypothetical protein